MSENFKPSVPKPARKSQYFLAGPTAKIMPDHTLPFGGNQDFFTGKGPICLCFFRHA